MKLFVVNLASSTARRDTMIRRLESLNLEHTMLEAIDARSFKQHDLDELKRSGALHQEATCSPGSIGCTLSHHAIYRRMIEEGIEHAVILEDDVTISPELPDLLESIQGHLVDGEVVLLYCTNEYKRGPSRTIPLVKQSAIRLTDSHSLYSTGPAKLHCTAGYALTRGTATRLLEKCTPIRFPPDVWSIWQGIGALDALRVVYPFAVVEEGGPSERLRGIPAAAPNDRTYKWRMARDMPKMLTKLAKQPLIWMIRKRNRWLATRVSFV